MATITPSNIANINNDPSSFVIGIGEFSPSKIGIVGDDHENPTLVAKIIRVASFDPRI